MSSFSPSITVNTSDFYPIDIPRALNKIRENAVNAIAAGDYTAARTLATQAMLLIATIPDGGSQGLTQTWDRPAIEMFMKQLDKLEAIAAEQANGLLVPIPYSYGGRRDC